MNQMGISRISKSSPERKRKGKNQIFNANLDFESGFWNIRAFRPDLII